MTRKDRLQQLFDQFLRSECTSEEVEELIDLLQDKEAEEILTPEMQRLWEKVATEKEEYPVDWQKMYSEITAREIAVVKRKRSLIWTIGRVAAAIAVLAILSLGVYWNSHSTLESESADEERPLAHDVVPGGNKAVLTLANGATIVLDQMEKGTLAKQGNMQIIKLDSGALTYQSTTGEKNSKVEYNSLTTPNGGQYQLQLPDGTRVWLNAASSIRYPTAFVGEQRQVSVTGEAYFEVQKDGTKPFIVDVGNMQVEVLGTHFNINAYADEEAMETTLLEGKVKVISDYAYSLVLDPGQQAQLNKEGRMKLIRNPDLDKVSAWQRGLFVFHSDDMPTIMRKLTRWYDIQVEYENNQVPSSHFTGAIQRNVNISEVLKMFELTGGASFEVEGKKVIVSS